MSAGLPASCTSSYQNSTGTTIAAVTTIVASQWKVTAQGAVVAEPLLKELVALERAARVSSSRESGARRDGGAAARARALAHN